MKPAALLGLVLACTIGATAAPVRTLVPLPVGPGGLRGAPVVASESFTFVLGGDNRATSRWFPIPPTAGQIFSDVRLLSPTLVVWTGDTIYGSDETVDEANHEYDTFLALAATGATPVYCCPGNHEIFNRPDMMAVYQKRMGLSYGSFDIGTSHFVGLSTEEPGQGASVVGEQLVWLRHDLEANRKARHIFVFMHEPVFDPIGRAIEPKNAAELHQLFLQYGVKHVFAGHQHMFESSIHDGITYWISGGAGAPNVAPPEKGGFQHYMLFNVDGDQVTEQVIEPWRLFSTQGPVLADGSRTGTLSNYTTYDLSMALQLPGVHTGDTVTAFTEYKGKRTDVPAHLEPGPDGPQVRLMVSANHAVVVTVKPQAP